jgi:hypothetical protein
MIFYIKKILIKLISFFLIRSKIIFLLEKRILKYRSLKYENKSIFPFLNEYNHLIDYFIVSVVYFKNYYSKIENPEKQRHISFKTLDENEGAKWAKHYFDKSSTGSFHRKERGLIYVKTEEMIKSNSLNNSNTLFINIGSSSGLDLVYFYKKFSKIKYLSTDINDEILNFQKQTYKNYSIDYLKGSADYIAKNLDYVASKHQVDKIILFCNGCLQYEIPFFLQKGFAYLSNSNVKFFFCMTEFFELNFSNSDSYHRKNILWVHNYPKYINSNNLKITWKKVSKENQIKNNSISIIFTNN